MGKYIKPKIKTIKIDSNQAVLQVCMTGGIFMMPTTVTRCWGGTPTVGGSLTCVTAVRGQSKGNVGSSSGANAPS